ncbi:hypothetical protein E2C01_077993 [Portunus trituberculatus]|uniref:Uncharacterized protein n=1 Tax=Portunus trituberculatus TaxID=210409 RepID=A0A5B7INR1_PORTR|nr:hypothetical protein [Portunus trituberculatus]
MNLLSILLLVAAAVASVMAQQKPTILLENPSNRQNPMWVQPPRFHYRGFNRPQMAARWP